MKIYLESSFKNKQFTCFPIVEYDESLDIDERKFKRIGTLSILDDVDIEDVVNAISFEFCLDEKSDEQQNKIDNSRKKSALQLF